MLMIKCGVILILILRHLKQWHIVFALSHSCFLLSLASLVILSFPLSVSTPYLMILLGSPTLNSVSSGVASQYHKLKNYNVNLFFNLCNACEQFANMSSIPFSAFSAGRIRDTQRDMKISHITKNKDSSSKYYNTTVKELSPLKYNSKLMNSIWGIYNRYSPHNVKKINDANVFAGEMQQSAATSSKPETVLSLPSALDKMWAAINVSQSH